MIFHYSIAPSLAREEFPQVPGLVSAGSWFKSGVIQIPRRVAHLKSMICDCGAFSVFTKYGEFPFSWGEYLAWVDLIRPDWFALWDKPGDPHQTQLFIDEQRTSGGIPTCQGTTPREYRTHAKELKGFPLIGVGNLVRSDYDVRVILENIITELPTVKLHLWGCGLKVLKKLGSLAEYVQSSDSSSWTNRFGKGLEEYKRYTELTQVECALRIMLPKYRAKIEALTSGWSSGRLHGIFLV